MPAFALPPTLSSINPRSATVSNATAGVPIQVICAWPVSGQYGPGSRVLYYALVAACVIARKKEWLKGPCLVATLLIPAVAALHGIVLASVNVPGAVDMDVYGVFQVCSIGVLTAMVTVMQSKTYFEGAGRNLIFMWSGLILAGLLSLTVEFYRITTHPCPAVHNINDFPYGSEMCGLTCSFEAGPFSPIRTGRGTNMGVIPAPTVLTFNTATLLSAACCIPAVLSIIMIWMKILEDRTTTLFGKRTEFGNKKSVSRVIQIFRKSFEIPVFAAAVIAILVVGENNLFSRQCRFETEPLDNIGQWGPIVGTVIAVLGSLYLLWEKAINDIDQAAKAAQERGRRPSQPDLGRRPSQPDAGRRPSQPTSESVTEEHDLLRVLAKRWVKFRNGWEEEVQDGNDETLFQTETKTNYPTVPGEELRNRDLSRLRDQYSGRREDDDSSIRSRSRAPSSPGSPTTPATERRDTLSVGIPTSPPPSRPRAGTNERSPPRSLPHRSTLETPGSPLAKAVQETSSPTPGSTSPPPSRPRSTTNGRPSSPPAAAHRRSTLGAPSSPLARVFPRASSSPSPAAPSTPLDPYEMSFQTPSVPAIVISQHAEVSRPPPSVQPGSRPSSSESESLGQTS